MTLDKIRADLFAHPDAEDDPDKSDFFYIAVNRALDFLFSNFPDAMVDKLVIEPNTLLNVLSSPVLNENISTVKPNTPLVRSAAGKAYYFEVSGNGSFTVASDIGNETVDFTHKGFTPYKRFCEGATTITFSGQYQFFVRNEAIYEATLSDKLEDIPAFSSSVEYNFKELTKEELAPNVYFYPFGGFIEDKFAEKGRDGVFVRLTEYEVVPNKAGHIIRLNGHATEQRVIYYKRNFYRVDSSTDPNTDIYIPLNLYDAFSQQLFAEYMQDEDEPSVELAGYAYRSLVNLKQAGATGENPVSQLINEMGY